MQEYLSEQGAMCWLVNTGRTGGAYGKGHRMSIDHTRPLLTAALDGLLAEVAFQAELFFGLSKPVSVPGVPDKVLDPARSWPNIAAYKTQARRVVSLFEKNFAPL